MVTTWTVLVTASGRRGPARMLSRLVGRESTTRSESTRLDLYYVEERLRKRHPILTAALIAEPSPKAKYSSINIETSSTMRGRYSLGVCLFFLAGVVLSTQAATITVTTGTDYPIGSASTGCSLRGAIVNANAGGVVDTNCATGSSGSDTIVVNVSTLVITQTGAGEDGGLTGDLDITSNLAIQSATSLGSTITGSGDRIIDVHGAVFVSFDNFTFTGGHDHLSDSLLTRFIGGAVAATDTHSELTFLRCSFTNNVAEVDSSTAGIVVGGAVAAGGDVFFSDSSFISNQITGTLVDNTRGGAAIVVLHTETIELNNSIISGNAVVAVSTALNLEVSGGVAVFGDSISITGSVLAQDNVGITGGAFYFGVLAGDFDCVAIADVSGNQATTGGFMHHAGVGSVDLDMDHFDIVGNNAVHGGVFYKDGSNPITVLDAGSINSNQASGNGGVVFADGIEWVRFFEQDEIRQNTALLSGGVIYGLDIDAEIRGGSIVGNVCGDEGGVIYVDMQRAIAADGVLISNAVEITDNMAANFPSSAGGVIFANNADVIIQNTAGDIARNFAYHGGVISLNDQASAEGAQILAVGGGIIDNIADGPDGAGAVIYAFNANAEIGNISGGLNRNLAENGDGGVIYVENASGLIHDIEGGIASQFAFDGGIMAVVAGATGVLRDVSGDIFQNTGFFAGGLLHCSAGADCTVQNISGSIVDTLCGSGCVIFSEDGATLDSVFGDISLGEAFDTGAVIHGRTIVATNIRGTILDNEAVNFGGGAFHAALAGATITLDGIFSLDSNFATTDGGVALNEAGGVTLTNICHMDNNVARTGSGGVARAGSGSVAVSNVGNTPTNNQPEDFFPSTSFTVLPPLTLSPITVVGFDGSGYQATVTPSGGTGAASEYLWSNGATTQTATGLTSTEFSVTVTDQTLCTATSTFTVVPPTFNLVGLTGCPLGDVALGGTPTATSALPGPLSYLWSPAEFIVSGSATTANPVVRVPVDTVFTVVAFDSITGTSAVGTQTVTVATITVDAGEDIFVCLGSSVQLGGAPTASGSPSALVDPPIIRWTPANALSSTTEANPTTTTQQTITYTATAGAANCPSLTNFDTVTVTVLQLTEPFAVASPNGEPNIPICAGGSVTLGGDSVGTPGPLEFLWTPATGLSDPTAAHPVASPASTTTYTLQVFTLNRCGVDEDSVTVTVSDLAADAGVDLVNTGILGGRPTASGGSSPYTFLWSPALGISSAVAANPAALPGAGAIYTVTVTDSVGCTAAASANVVVQNLGTAGELDVSFVLRADGQTLPQAAQQVVNQVAGQLGLPSPDVVVPEIDDGVDSDFDAVVNIFTFNGVSGNALAAAWAALYGCDTAALPCAVASTDATLAASIFSSLTFNALVPVPGSVSLFTTYEFGTTDYSTTTSSPTSDSSSSSSSSSDTSSSDTSSSDTSSSRISTRISTFRYTFSDSETNTASAVVSSAIFVAAPLLLLL